LVAFLREGQGSGAADASERAGYQDNGHGKSPRAGLAIKARAQSTRPADAPFPITVDREPQAWNG